jgi:hypothetical protein
MLGLGRGDRLTHGFPFFAYGTQVLHQSRDFLLTALITAGLISFVTIPVDGALAPSHDRCPPQGAGQPQRAQV